MVHRTKSDWSDETLDPVRKRFDERKNQFKTSSDIEIDALYNEEDSRQRDSASIGYPGEYPFTRGVQPNMYRGRLWTMRQYAGLASPEESNKRYRYLLEQGQSGLSVAFDLPTQTGYDSDHPMASGEIGRTGVPVSTLADMEILFDAIPLDKVSTSMTINSTASILLALYVAVAKRQGVKPESLSGTIQNDILKEYIARGTYIYPPEASMKLVTDTFSYCADNIPRWNTISISGYHMSEAGANAVQELAFTFSNAIAYVKAAIDSGMEVDTFADRLSFFFVSQSNLFEEVAKFRAARRMWATIMRDRFNAKSKRSLMMRFHTQTAGVTLTAQQPDNNIVRVAVQSMAAVLGGTQSLHTNSRDEAFEYIDKIEGMGGAVEALKEGFQMMEIHDSAYLYQRDVENKDRIVVGVNEYVSDAPQIEALQTISKTETERQLKRLARVKSERNSKAVMASLAKLREIVLNGSNTVPGIIDCVESYCTVGEISDVFREIYGEQKEFTPF